MSSFRNTPEEWQRLDYQILQNGCASLYWKPENLLLDIEWFKSKNFRIAEIDCAEANNLLFEIGKKLDFHNYSGKSLDAFNDCLSDIEINESGTIVVLRHFHLIDTKFAYSLLSVFADNSRRHILFGKNY